MAKHSSMHLYLNWTKQRLEANDHGTHLSARLRRKPDPVAVSSKRGLHRFG
jgi:hypothetical protein